MQRRSFLATCATGALVAGADALREAAGQSAPRIHGRARLVDAAGRAIRATEIPIGRNLVFHYPYFGTPAFLLNLGS
ncbi:MAG: (2Fe-2S)-binding protein, partial [Burkholderiales bacterium]